MLTSKPVTIFERFEMGKKRGQRKGELINRSGRWLLRYHVDGTEIDPATGKKKRQRVTVQIALSAGPGAVGLRDARRIAWNENLSTLDSAHVRPSSSRTFREFLDIRYRPDVIASLKPSTQAFAESILRKHVVPMLGPVPLREFTPGHVQDVINAKRAQKLSTQTLAHIRNRIGAVLRHAKAHQWFFGEIPTEAVRMPEMIREELHTLTWLQVTQLANALPEPCATLVVFLALTGLRIGEAMGLRWKRVNLTESAALVDGAVIPPMCLQVRENYVMGKYQTLKTGTAYRTVPIPAWFGPRIAALSSSSAKGSEGQMESPVFVNLGRSAPMDQHNTAARVLKPAAKLLGMPWLSWHTLRRTNSTLADQIGVSVAERQKLLGHATAAMNMHYTEADLDRLRPRIEAMADPKLLN